MLRSELTELTLKAIDKNIELKMEYDNLVQMLKHEAAKGNCSLRVNNVNACVLKKLHNDGIRSKTIRDENNTVYELTWM